MSPKREALMEVCGLHAEADASPRGTGASRAISSSFGVSLGRGSSSVGRTNGDRFFQYFNCCVNPAHIGIAHGDVHRNRACV
jgi:hypothetical protein